MNNYEAKKQARIDRYNELAGNAEKRSTSLSEESSRMASVIPFGQPILVGHHSEKADRNYRTRIQNKMFRSCEESSKAQYYKDKAVAAENNTSISSDDPEAVTKLKEKIENAVKKQELMKAINRILKNKKLSDDEKVNKVVTAGLLTSATAQALLKPDFCGRIGFAGYQLTNNNANINRMKKRLESLENMPTESKTTNHDGFDVVENAEINRIQIVFPGKPDTETRSILKQNGFRWSRYEMAWQRHLNNSGRYAVSNVLSGIRGLNY